MNCHAILTDPTALRPVHIWASCLKNLKVFAKVMLTASSNATTVIFFNKRGVVVDHLKRQGPKAMKKAAGR